MGKDISISATTTRGAARLVQSVGHALAILDCFQLDRPVLGVSELSRELGVNKATVSRLLATLEAYGFVRQDQQNRRYRLGVKCSELGFRVLQHTGLREAARPQLEVLTRVTGETAHLAVFDRGDMTYLDVEECSKPLRVHSQLGARNLAHTVASGKASLAFLDTALLKGYLAKRYPRDADPAAFLRELTEVRTRGFAVNRGEWVPGVVGVAAPVRDHTGAVVAAVTVSAPASRLGGDRIDQVIAAVTGAARETSRHLGFAPSKSTFMPSTAQPSAGRDSGIMSSASPTSV